ncbi:MAG: hypothetical protein ACREBQ_02195, partial [Nitrososphaerales archaeon]
MNAYRDAMSVEASDSVFGVNLSPIRDILRTHGFESTTSRTLRGISGALQDFDLVARRGNETIAIDVLPA